MDSDEMAELRALIAAQTAMIGALVAAQKAPAQPSVTVAEVYRQYEIAQKHRPGWVTSEQMLRPIVRGLPERFDGLGTRQAATLVVSDWTTYRVSRPTLAPSSLNLALAFLKAMLRWAKREGLLSAVPQLCEATKQKAKGHRETAPTEDDIGKLLDESTRTRDKMIVLCACDSGMRSGEIRRLEWSWLDRARMEIRIPAAATKTKKARAVPMTERQLAAIDAMPRDIRNPLVMPSPRTNGPYTKTAMSMIWRALATSAQLEAAPGEVRVRLHDGRHGFATNAAKRGVRIEVLQKILGHASIEQTSDYVTTGEADLTEARIAFEAGIKYDKR